MSSARKLHTSSRLIGNSNCFPSPPEARNKPELGLAPGHRSLHLWHPAGSTAFYCGAMVLSAQAVRSRYWIYSDPVRKRAPLASGFKEIVPTAKPYFIYLPLLEDNKRNPVPLDLIVSNFSAWQKYWWRVLVMFDSLQGTHFSWWSQLTMGNT